MDGRALTISFKTGTQNTFKGGPKFPLCLITQLVYNLSSDIIMCIVLSQDASFDISVYLGSGSEQYHGSTAANDIPGSVTLHCPAADEFSGSVLLKQASLTMVDEDYDIPFVPSGNYSVHFNLLFANIKCPL